MAQGKQAKILSKRQESAILRHLESVRYPERDRVIFMFSIKAGLRAKEISLITWAMVTDAEGQVGDTIALEDEASKGNSGRTIPMHPELQGALVKLHVSRGALAGANQPVIFSEREPGLSAMTVKQWFHRLYTTLGMTGCSSHSGRRTFITRAAKKVSSVGGSLRDVQQLAGHASMQTTQLYIEGDSDAKRRLVSIL